MMRILLLQPEDSSERGPWSRQHWDLIFDLGKSSQFSAEKWGRQYGCPVLRTDSFRHGIADGKKLRELFSAGRGYLVDEEGIDWWDLMLPLLTTDGLTALALRGVAEEVNSSAELWATRPGGLAAMLAVALGRAVRDFGESRIVSSFARIARYAGLVRRFSSAQIKEIFLDKYDPGYEWRSRFAGGKRACNEPAVLLPSAYENVSRMAAAYARILPKQTFLMVATRQSAKKFVSPANVHVRDLADYASAAYPAAEASSLVERWTKLRADLQSSPELNILLRSGVLDEFPSWIRDGLRVRNAWRGVLDREVIKSVLCGDDSNRYTRLPVLLAARRKIPTVDFHHGAMDGRYVLKELPCDLYLTKNEMERDYMVRVCGLPQDKIALGAPLSAVRRPVDGRRIAERSSIVFFSEPYEVAGMRTQEVYRELLPPLCRVARESGRGLILKLHPFESLSQRRTMVREILAPEDCKIVTVVDGPLTTELLAEAWCGITVESTTVIDCLQNGIRCFLCVWLAHSPFDYVQQYARFGIGEALQNTQQLLEIPRRMADAHHPPTVKIDLSPTVDPATLQDWLTKPCGTLGARSLG
jgi:hypothetical protein